MRLQIELWIMFLSVSIICALCKHKRTNKCNQHGGCDRKNVVNASNIAAVTLRSSRKPLSQDNALIGQLSQRRRYNTLFKAKRIHKKWVNLETKLIVVRSLADNIITAQNFKEESIGIYIREYIDSVTMALARLHALLIAWTEKAPTIEEFLDGVTLALDDLTIASPEITEDLIRIRDLEFNTLPIMTKATRLNYIYKRFRGTEYMSNKFEHPKHSLKRKGYAKVEESHWWRPIVRFTEHLKHSKQWMRFLEELNLRLEATDTQLRRNELSMIFERTKSGMEYKIDSVTDLFDKLNQNFYLISLRNITKDIIATANANRLKYLDQIVQINILDGSSCEEINGIAHVVAPHLTTASAIECTRSLLLNNSQINAVAFIGSVRFIIEQDLYGFYFRNSSLEFNKGFHFIMISPEWVSLAGQQPGHLRNILIPGRQPPDYSKKSKKTTGDPGLPGEEGGRFYAFGSYVLGAGLAVNIDGGQGGKGQDGGISDSLLVACFRDETNPGLDCCLKHARFINFGNNGGVSGEGGGRGVYKLFIFTNESRNKFLIHQEKGLDGLGGQGSRVYRHLEDGFKPTKKMLDESYITYSYEEGYCPFKLRTIEYFPLSDEAENFIMGNDNISQPSNPRQPPKEITFGPEKSASAILMYKLWSLRHSHTFNIRKIREFASNSDNDNDFQALLSTADLIDEFNNLEKEARTGYLDKEALKLSYLSIAFRAQRKSQNYTGKNKECHMKVLLFLSSAARSKMLAIISPYEPILVVNILRFLKEEKKTIDALKKTAEEEFQYQYINSAVDSYNQKIQDHFKDTDFLINSTIFPDFDEIEVQMTQLMQFLLDTIEKLKENEEQNRNELRKYRRVLMSHQAGNLLFNLLKLSSNLVAVLHPAAGAISFGVDLRNDAFIYMSDKRDVTPKYLPEALNSASTRSALRFRKSADYYMKGIIRQLNAIKIVVETESKYFPKTLDVLGSMSSEGFPRAEKDVETPIDAFPPADCVLSFKFLMKTKRMIREVKLNLSTTIKLDYDNAINQVASSKKLSNETEQRLKNVAAVATTLAMGASGTYNQWQQDRRNIEEVTRAIQKCGKKILAYQEHIDEIENELIPDIDKMFEVLSDARQDLADNSFLALQIVQHTLQKTIRNAQLYFKKEIVAGTGLVDYFDRALQSTVDAVGTLINIYERLCSSKEQRKLSNFTAEVALNPKHYLVNLSDANMQKKFNKLRYTLQGEVLLKRQSLIEGAFRMWKFPMVDPDLCNLTNLSALALDFSTSEKVYNFLADMEKRIGHLIDFVKQSQSTEAPEDQYTLITEFTRKESGFPFYKWDNFSTSRFISDLLQGRRVYLRSKESTGVPFCDVVKFNRIALSFGSSAGNQALEHELNAVLNDYRVILTHTGNSFYFFGNQSFVLNSEKIELSFTFKVDANGVPVIRNNVYDELLAGQLTVSPYTTWLIKIQPIDPKIKFKPLEKFARKLDLYLEGSGRCVKHTFATEGKFESPTCEGFPQFKNVVKR